MEGKIVPVRITVKLINKAMLKAGYDKKFLIDGFPRSHDNVEGWNDVMGQDAFLAGVLHFDADEQVMTDRIIKRAEASGPNARNDDNLETLKKRFAQFKAEQLPIILSFGDLVHTINAEDT